jgi:Terminase large subunit, T4likevirus-type, N-terminal
VLTGDGSEIITARPPGGWTPRGETDATFRPALWRPQPGPQRRFVEATEFEVVYGGARGGGKTDGALGDFLYHAAYYGADARGLYLRRQRTALESTIARGREVFATAGARWVETKSRFQWPNGARLSMGYLDRDRDAERYQGQDFTRIYVDELTQFAHPGSINKLKATLRSARGAHCGLRATCNPGGVGHAWVKARYVDPGPEVPIADAWVDPLSGETHALARMFLPARIGDNLALIRRDPTYVARLAQSGSQALVRAWLEGDWSIIDGAFFDNWSLKNVAPPFPIPSDWARIRSLDWGYAAPFSVGWWAIVSDDHPLPDDTGRILPRGAMVRYREWYGATAPNAGLRQDAEELADGILAREQGERIAKAVADPSIFAEDGGPSLAERMRRRGVNFVRADNSRVGKLGAMSGWDQMRHRIRGVDGRPMLYVFSTCREFLRTVPVLQHDPHRPEDLDTRGEDHIADETRYACMARRLPPAPATAPGSGFDSFRGRRDPVAGWKAI